MISTIRWWVAIIIGIVSVFVYNIIKVVLGRFIKKPFLLIVCSFVVLMLLCVVVGLCIKYMMQV